MRIKSIFQCLAILAFLCSLVGMHCSCPELPASGNTASGTLTQGTIAFAVGSEEPITWSFPSQVCYASVGGNARLVDAATQPIETQVYIECETEDLPGVVRRASFRIFLPDLRDLDGEVHLTVKPDTDRDGESECDGEARCGSIELFWDGNAVAEPDSTETTLQVNVREARGSRAPYPDNVTDNFARTIELRAHLPATWRPAIEVTASFFQTARDYRNGWEYWDQTGCEYGDW